ncbi:lipase family protein [Micromonospora sp. NPDC093244]|uniref:lipase family protein n=1 Tax=Micromonospora sp. NPDC093244 TaxID=3155071 RepID=UPI003431C09E
MSTTLINGGHRMSARALTRAAALAVVVGLGLAALPGATASASTVSRGITIPAFYSPPAQLPAANGALVRSEPLPLSLSLPGLDGRPIPGRATRIMYKTTDSNGQPAAATGAYIEPSASWPGSGPRPLVVLAPGTSGQGDQCATSLGLQNVIAFGNSTLSIGIENLAIYQLLGKGIAVAVSDHIGLGTTDRLHTYVNRLDEGHAVLDAARAARSLPGVSVTAASPTGLYGFSQGGGAVGAAIELQPTYAPDVPVSASYAGAVPADLAAVTSGIDGTELVASIGWSLNGFAQSDPSLQAVLDNHLSFIGKAVLKDLTTRCIWDAMATYSYQRTNGWTKNLESASAMIAAEPRLRAFIEQQRIGTQKPAGIVRVATGVNDNLVQHAQARQLALDWCQRGGNVVYAPISGINGPSPFLNHVDSLLKDQGTAITWLTDRLKGTPEVSNCATVSQLP